MSSIVNKVKDALSSDKKHEQPEGTSGPHNSRAANAADPRIDSDRDHRANPAGVSAGATNTHSTGMTGTHGTTGTSGLTGTHGTTGTSGLTGTHGTTGTTGYDDPAGTHGPHGSRVANQADPRVDSDRDHRGAPGSGLTGTHGTHGTTGTSGLTGTHGTTGTSGLTGSNAQTGYDDPAGTHGPHSSRAANQADPRIDSDRDHRGAPGSGLTGTHGTTGTTGTHGSSGLTGGTSTTHSGVGHAGAAVGGTHGTGPAPNTAGPHKSDALNKADPRVDSDLDGSKTVGGNKTYAQSNATSGVAKDPTDAAQVPPSVLAKHIGEPEIAHGDHGHDRARRNSKVSAQELHRGL